MKEAKPFVVNEEVSIRLMRDEADDYELMAKWLSDERVLEFYDGRDSPYDIERVREKYSPRILRREAVVPCFVNYGDRPIGYIQYYPVDEGFYYGIETEDGAYGVDLFIGEPELWNRGIGTRALSALLGYLFGTLEARKVVIDPHVTNHRAIRCYEKCGFRKIKVLPKHELHEGEYRDSWLMMIDRPSES